MHAMCSPEAAHSTGCTAQGLHGTTGAGMAQRAKQAGTTETERGTTPRIVHHGAQYEPRHVHGHQ